ncbi:MAG: hypothetical protein Barrevirus41_1, partial [Barrevirus sp.]
MGCCGPSPDDACGWPKNTIRALLAVLIVVLAFAIAAAVIIILIINQHITEAIGVLGIVFTVVGSVTAFYFSSQQAQANNKAMVDANQRILEAKDREIGRMTETHEKILRDRGLLLPTELHQGSPVGLPQGSPVEPATRSISPLTLRKKKKRISSDKFVQVPPLSKGKEESNIIIPGTDVL